MAAEKTKRALPAKVEAMKARKRQKLGGSPEEPKISTTPVARKPGGPARLDDLTWNEVAMPDRLEDFEGFYGLEEIDDVDVVKNETTGQVSYVAGGKHATVKDDAHLETNRQDLDEEEFSGFSDEDDAPKPPASMPDSSVVKPAKSNKVSASDKKSKSKAPLPKVQEAKPVTFAAMDGGSEEEEVTDVSAWKPLKLSPDTLASLSRLKFSDPTPIQLAAIPEILAGHDVIGKASTGSGKTLAFGIPIFEAYLEKQLRHKSHSKGSNDKPQQRPPTALILSPTRELAHQLASHLNDLCAGLPSSTPSVATLTGGLSVQKQQRVLKTADIIIGTPGRLWEVISGGHGLVNWLKKIQFLVLDEADRLLSQGHFKELEEILNVLEQSTEPEQQDDSEDAEPVPEEEQRPRQTLVFSATFGKELQQKLAGRGKSAFAQMDRRESMEYLLKKLNFREEKPHYIDVNPKNQMAQGLKEGLVECAGTEKDLYLYSLLLLHPTSRTLVFTNSISAVRRLTPFLQNLGLPALALHSQMPQKARLRSIERFSGTTKSADEKPNAHKGSILVATDVAARGLDVPHVHLVVHYHLPRAADTYVHRSGRTARAGETGSSILICGPEEVASVRRLVAKVHVRSAAAAEMSEKEAARQGYLIRSLDIDRRVVARLKPRATLAKQLADVTSAKEKGNTRDDVLRQGAEDLGVDYDSEELEKEVTGKRGRGAGRIKKEREARSLTKDETQSLRYELNQLLKQRVNVGVSERYPTAGGIDIDELLRQGDTVKGDFLGEVQGIGMED